MGSPLDVSLVSVGYLPESAASNPKSESTAGTAPIVPSLINRRACSTAGKHRVHMPSIMNRFLDRASATSAVASAPLHANGFSTTQCLPHSRTAVTCSTLAECNEERYTTSTAGSRSASAYVPTAFSKPCRSRNASARGKSSADRVATQYGLAPSTHRSAFA